MIDNPSQCPGLSFGEQKQKPSCFRQNKVFGFDFEHIVPATVLGLLTFKLESEKL